MKRLICAFLGHRWDRRLDDIPTGTYFARIDCARCGLAIDGAALRRIRDEMPELWNRVKGRMP